MKIATFIRHPAHRRWLLVEAAIRLLAVRIAFALFGYRRMVTHFGVCEPVDNITDGTQDCSGTISAADELTARTVGWAVTAAARHLPVDTLCLHQALTARRMLSRRDIHATMYFGVQPDKRLSEAENHAWLAVGEIPVTGYPLARRCVAYSRFSSGPIPSERTGPRRSRREAPASRPPPAAE